MGAILSVIAVVLISLLINRFATVALSLTGMSREEARFQARAAMSGVGLTTSRADDIVGHPIRRRIVLWLMIVGSAGVVTAVASLVLSCRGADGSQPLSRAAVLVGALLVLWLITRTPPVDRALTRGLAWWWASIVAAAPISECPGPRRSLHRGTRSCYMGARRGSASSTGAGEAHAVTPLTR
jgi:hypothetical protein